MSPAVEDTIAAVATARGVAALAVVRLSGPMAVSIADASFRGSDGRLADAPTRTLHVGHWLDGSGVPVDRVVVGLFRAPNSPTGEDVVEISCHGGQVVTARILARLYESGARPARAGEFTQRAFVHGKLDLAQAEAVADIIHAQADRAHAAAQRQLDGRFSALLGRLRDELTGLCALVELELDFSDTDQVFADLQRLRAVLRQCRGTIGDLVSHARTGSILRDGVRVVIAGRPNAGKSTLLNALVGHDRVIVSEIEGTTRDLVEVDLELDGLVFRLVDTAGIREVGDEIEAEGIRRAREAAKAADIVLYVFDAELGLQSDEEASVHRLRSTDRPVVLVANKIDRAPGGVATGSVVPIHARKAVEDPRELSALLAALRLAAAPLVRDAEDSPVLLNARHRAHLQAADEALLRVEVAMDAGVPGDLLSIDLRVALHELGCITGVITNEEVLDSVFSRFCIGK